MFIKLFETIDQLRIVIVKSEGIKKCLESHGIDYTGQDARMLFLDQIQMEINTTILWKNAYSFLLNYCSYDLKKFSSCIGSSIEYCVSELYMFNQLKYNLIIQFHFKIDNLFGNILKALNSVIVGYYKMCTKFECLNIISEQQKKELLVLSYLRNSFHNNGIHRNANFSTQIGCKPFDFQKNRKVECASWEHINILLISNINIIKVILNSTQIVAIPSIIDDFANSNRF